MMRSFLPLILSSAVLVLAIKGGDVGRGVAFIAALVTYLVAFCYLTNNNGEGDTEANPWLWLANAFALGAVFLVGLTSLSSVNGL